MWSPTHVQVLVKRAKGLKIKGKHGSNDPFVTIGLGKEKFQTSVVEKTTDSVEWMEQCELAIPSKGNTAEIVLTVLHRNFLGVDEFLGRVPLPLSNFDHHDKPKSRWYPLQCKPGQNKTDYRGELEVRIEFKVNASETLGGSVADLRSKKKGSLSSLSKLKGNVGGSLMNIGSKQTGIKKFADSVGHKLDKVGGKAKKSISSLKLNKDKKNLDSVPEGKELDNDNPNLDPGVNSDDEDNIDDIFKKVSRSGSTLSLSKRSVDSFQQSPGMPPKKPDRSFTTSHEQSFTVGGNSNNLYSFDLTLERSPLKLSNMNLNTFAPDNNEGDEVRKKKKKDKKKDKEKRDKKDKKEKKKEKQQEFTNNENDFIDCDSNRPIVSEELLDMDFEDDNIEVVETAQVKTNNHIEASPPQRQSDILNFKRPQDFSMQQKKNVTVSQPASTPPKQNMFLDLKQDIKPKTKVEQFTLIDSDSDSNDDIDEDDDDGQETPADEKLPLEVLSKFNGKTRENAVDVQGKKITDLEGYIDNLLSKVIEVAPVVLQKDIRNANRTYYNQVFNKRSKFG